MGTTSVGEKLKATIFIRLACGLNRKRAKARTVFALSAHLSGTFGLPSAYACAELPAGKCPHSLSKRLVSVVKFCKAQSRKRRLKLAMAAGVSRNDANKALCMEKMLNQCFERHNREAKKKAGEQRGD